MSWRRQQWRMVSKFLNLAEIKTVLTVEKVANAALDNNFWKYLWKIRYNGKDFVNERSYKLDVMVAEARKIYRNMKFVCREPYFLNFRDAHRRKCSRLKQWICWTEEYVKELQAEISAKKAKLNELGTLNCRIDDMLFSINCFGHVEKDGEMWLTKRKLKPIRTMFKRIFSLCEKTKL